MRASPAEPDIDPRSARIRIFGFGPRCAPVLLEHPRFGGGARLWLGAPRFDGSIVLRGDEAAARALLGATGRELAARLFASGVERLRIHGRVWVALGRGEGQLGAARAAFDGLRELARKGTELDRLLEVAVADPEVRVRAGAADLLLSRASTLDAADLGRVCIGLIASPHTRERHRVDAAWLLARRAPRMASGLLEGRAGPELVRAFGTASVRSGGVEAVIGYLADPSPEVAAAAIDALSPAIDRPEVRGPVVARLSSGAPAVRKAAAAALGHSTVDLAPVVHVLGSVSGARRENRELRRTAARAVARVRRRGAPAGALTVLDSGTVGLVESGLGQTFDTEL